MNVRFNIFESSVVFMKGCCTALVSGIRFRKSIRIIIAVIFFVIAVPHDTVIMLVFQLYIIFLISIIHFAFTNFMYSLMVFGSNHLYGTMDLGRYYENSDRMCTMFVEKSDI